jgi:hypothetical protein
MTLLNVINLNSNIKTQVSTAGIVIVQLFDGWVSHLRTTRIETYCVVVVVCILSGCATNGSFAPPAADSMMTLSVPISYTDGLGVGAGAVQGAVEMAKGSEAKSASRAIVLALQDMETNLKTPRLGAGELLPQKLEWVSDRAPLPLERIRGHNALNPEMKLAEQFKYQIEFVGDYVVDRSELLFRISARVFESASAAEPREYRQPYSGKFFVDALGKLIREKLITPTPGKTQ